jgi:hypothetical protein
MALLAISIEDSWRTQQASLSPDHAYQWRQIVVKETTGTSPESKVMVRKDEPRRLIEHETLGQKTQTFAHRYC